MPMGMRRFTQLTDGFSKKVENLTLVMSPPYLHDNFGRPQLTLAKEVARAGQAGHPGDGRRRRQAPVAHRSDRWAA